MQALSPKSVHEAAPEDINEVRLRLTANPRRSDLRRSLFKANEQRLLTTAPSYEIPCSTPMTSRRNTTKTSFMDDNVNISPIRNLNKRNEDGIEVIEVQLPQTQKTPTKIVRVETLGNIEKDLREQFQVDVQNAQKTPKSKKKGDNSCFSEPGRSPKPSSAKKSMPPRRPSEPPRRPSETPLALSKTKPFSIRIEPINMEMSEELIKTYQSSQMRRLSISECNKTDMQSLKIAETPVASSNHQQRPQIDEELAKRLQLCESDSDMTSDEDEIPEQEAIVPQVKSPAKRSTFIKPATTQKDDMMSVVSQNSSINKKVSDNVIESLRELRRTITNETANSVVGVGSNVEITSQSCRLNVTKKRRQSKTSGQVEEYMKLTRRRKKSKDSQNKKRTLYSHHSDEDDDENVSPQSSIASSSQKKSSVEVIYREKNYETTESNTDSSAHEFRKPYKPGPLKTKKKYGIVQDPPTVTRESSSTTVEDGEIRETPKRRSDMQRASGHKLQELQKSAKKKQQDEEQEASESEPEQPVVKKSLKKSHKSGKNRHEQQQEEEIEEEEIQEEVIEEQQEPEVIYF